MKSYVKPNVVGDFLDIETCSNIGEVYSFSAFSNFPLADMVCLAIPCMTIISKRNPEPSATQPSIYGKFSVATVKKLSLPVFLGIKNRNCFLYGDIVLRSLLSMM